MVKKRLGGLALCIAEYVLPTGDIDHALVQVHGAAGLALHGFGHKGGVHVFADGHFANGAFEQKYLIGQRQRVAVIQIDFHLRRAHFVNQRVHADVLCFAPVVHHIEDVFVVVHGVDAETLPPGFGAAGAPHRRLQRQVFIRLHLHQIKFHFRRNHRPHTQFFVFGQHAFEHIARRQLHRRAVKTQAVVDDLRRRLRRPRHQAHGVGIGQ